MTLPTEIDRPQPTEADRFISGLVTRYPSPVELVLPYHFDDPYTKNLVDACLRTKFGGALWNMDSPWIMTVVLTLSINIALVIMGCIATFLRAGYHYAGSGFYAASSLVFLFGFPIVYALLISLNLFLGYGKRWWMRLLGPTHIGITELGFKLYFRGKLFYNYPYLALWTDIRNLTVRDDSSFGCRVIEFTYKNSYYKRTVELPLAGFANDDDVRRFLQHVQQYVPCCSYSASFQSCIADECRGALDDYRTITPGSSSIGSNFAILCQNAKRGMFDEKLAQAARGVAIHWHSANRETPAECDSNDCQDGSSDTTKNPNQGLLS